MRLTPEQMREIRQIMEDAHSAFVVNYISDGSVPPEVLRRLRAMGLVSANRTQAIKDAYLLGQVMAAKNDPRLKGMTYPQLKQYLTDNPVPLGPNEQRSVRIAEDRAAQYVVGLGNRVSAATGQTVVDADTALDQQFRDAIRTTTSRNIAKRETIQRLRSDLGHKTGDWTRDLDRIALTEKQEAMQRGTAAGIARQAGGGALVAKRSSPTCCEHCRRLYVGPDGAPYIFKLADLEANGTNQGRKVADWLPVVGSTHPNCVCVLVRVPAANWGFNAAGQLVPKGPLGLSAPSEPLQASQAARRPAAPGPAGPPRLGLKKAAKAAGLAKKAHPPRTPVRLSVRQILTRPPN